MKTLLYEIIDQSDNCINQLRMLRINNDFGFRDRVIQKTRVSPIQQTFIKDDCLRIKFQNFDILPPVVFLNKFSTYYYFFNIRQLLNLKGVKFESDQIHHGVLHNYIVSEYFPTNIFPITKLSIDLNPEADIYKYYIISYSIVSPYPYSHIVDESEIIYLQLKEVAENIVNYLVYYIKEYFSPPMSDESPFYGADRDAFKHSMDFILTKNYNILQEVLFEKIQTSLPMVNQ